MHFDAPQWLNSLKTHSEAANVEHLDLVINATLLDYPLLQRLAELDPPPPQALLLEGTPEYALASQGPVLIRVFWEHANQIAWLGEFLAQFHGKSRALALLSRWPFDALTEHLRYCTQAEWDNGASSGILRYYDTRLFKHISGLFMADAARDFHAPAISWHWIDRDRKAQAIGGDQRKLYEFVRPQTPLMLDQRQMESIRARTKAEQWEDTHGLTSRNYSVSKEQRVAQIHLGLIVADNKHLKGNEHTAFMVEWLAQNLPEKLPSKNTFL
jgi:hypothetical protein